MLFSYLCCCFEGKLPLYIVFILQDIAEFIKGEENPSLAQLEILQTTILHPLNVQLAVKEEYQKHFLKQLISQVRL